MLPVWILSARCHQVKVTLRDRQQLVLAFDCILADKVVVIGLLVPLVQVVAGLHDGLVVDTPSDKVLLAVSFKAKLMRTLVTYSLTELFV
jgi:hypothetical protein